MDVTCKNVFGLLGLICLCFVGIPLRVKEQDSTEQEFLQFIENHNKSYAKEPTEYARRLEYFKASQRRATYYNRHHKHGNATFGITKFSDLGEDEFQRILLRHKPSPLSCIVGSHLNNLHKRRSRRNVVNLTEQSKELPNYVDWREKGVITAIKNQYSCGACWAFSTVATIESMHAIRKQKLKEFSIQQVIDCARNGNMGCSGGDTCTALTWMASSNVTILEENQYPLTLKEEKCRTFLGSAGVRLASNFTCYNLVDNEEKLKTILAFHGPVTAAVDAATWQDYLGGIIQYHCRDHTNHAVQIVGYDTRGPIPYYIVRNSWGPDFGIDGYLHIAIGKNLCGIASEISALDVVG